MARGYSIVAYTDHNIMIDHSYLADEGFLPLRGYEIDITENKDAGFCNKKCCHICFIAKDPKNTRQVCFHRTKHLVGNTKNYVYLVDFDESLPDYERFYNPESINDIIRLGLENGFFITYNHPIWSMETRDEYLKYDGMHAMEICNWSSYSSGFDDYVPQIYDEMLRAGKRIYCTAADDNHNRDENQARDSFGGFNMIKADKLEYRAIINALSNGHFYASMGPEIFDLYIEDGRIYITCSPAKRIMMAAEHRNAQCVWAKDSEPLTEASFEISEAFGYVRLTVEDENGRYANTQAYFLDAI
jgi:hypothetical protein